MIAAQSIKEVMDLARRAERLAVAVYLRECADSADDLARMNRLRGDELSYTAQRCMAECLRNRAGAIERGDHAKRGGA